MFRRIIFNTILGLVLILIWLKFVNIRQILADLSKVDLLSLVPVFLFMLLSPVIRALRLKIFLAEIKKIPLMNLIFLNGVALVLNFFIPVRAGEVAKGVYLATYEEQEKIRKRSDTNIHLNVPPRAGPAKWIVWIFLDRFVDFLVVLLLTTALFFITPTALNIKFITIITIILFLALFFTYVIVYRPNLAQKLFKFLSCLLILKSIKIYFERLYTFFLQSFSVLKRHPKDLLILTVITILAYAADAAIWYFTFIALGSHQGFVKMYLGQLLSALTYLIPAAPGYIGSAEASGLLILSGVFGMEANLASAMTLLFHITSAIFAIVYGLVSVFSLKMDLGIILGKVFKKKINLL